MKGPAVGAILDRRAGTKAKPDYLAARHMLECVIIHSRALIPRWFSGTRRIACNAWRLQEARRDAAVFQGEAWAIDVWWARLSPK